MCRIDWGYDRYGYAALCYNNACRACRSYEREGGLKMIDLNLSCNAECIQHMNDPLPPTGYIEIGLFAVGIIVILIVIDYLSKRREKI